MLLKKKKVFGKVRQSWVQIPPLSLPQLSKLVNLPGPPFHPLYRLMQKLKEMIHLSTAQGTQKAFKYSLPNSYKDGSILSMWPTDR